MQMECSSSKLHLKIDSEFSKEIAWATFSESKDIIVKNLALEFDNKITWNIARKLGFGYWLSNADAAVTYDKTHYLEKASRSLGAKSVYDK